MARKKARSEWSFAEYKGILQLPLLEEHEPLLEEWDELPRDEFEEFLEMFLLEGHSLELRMHEYAGELTFQATAKGFAEKSQNAGYWYFATGETPMEAISTALFKHFVAAKGIQWSDAAIERTKRKRS